MSVKHEDHLRKGQDVQFFRSLVSGSLSGLVARTVTAPLDTIKIRLQITPNIEKRGLPTLIQEMVHREGWKSFWKGNLPGSMMYIVYGGSQFGSYTLYNKWMAAMNLPGPLHSGVVGCLSGVTSSFVSYPLDTLRTRFVANRERQLFQWRRSVRDVWRHEGLYGFYHGCGITMVSLTLATGLMFGTYESVKIYCEKRNGPEWLDHSAGLLSGVVSKTLTFPLDTLRRRAQLRGSVRLAMYKQYSHYHKAKGVWQIGQLIFKHEGVTAFYRGLLIALCKSVPTTVISLWCYEIVMSRGV